MDKCMCETEREKETDRRVEDGEKEGGKGGEKRGGKGTKLSKKNQGGGRGTETQREGNEDV